MKPTYFSWLKKVKKLNGRIKIKLGCMNLMLSAFAFFPGVSWNAYWYDSISERAAWKRNKKYWESLGYGVESPFSESEEDDSHDEEDEDDFKGELDEALVRDQPPAPLSIKKLRHMAAITMAEEEIREEIRGEAGQEEDDFSAMPGEIFL